MRSRYEKPVTPLVTSYDVSKSEVILMMGRIDRDVSKEVEQRLWQHNKENPYFAVEVKDEDEKKSWGKGENTSLLIRIKNYDPVLLAKTVGMIMSYKCEIPVKENIQLYNHNEEPTVELNNDRKLKFVFGNSHEIPKILNEIKDSTDSYQAKSQIDDITRSYQENSR